MGAQWKTEGLSALWPEINGRLLASYGMAGQYALRNEIKEPSKQILSVFEAITGNYVNEVNPSLQALDNSYTFKSTSIL